MIHWSRPSAGWGALGWETSGGDLQGDGVASDGTASEEMASAAAPNLHAAEGDSAGGHGERDRARSHAASADGRRHGDSQAPQAGLPPFDGPGLGERPAPLAGLEALAPPVEELWSSRPLGPWASGPRIAIVGSRSPSPYGLEQAERFAAGMTSAGWAVWSGLARGIDAAAHLACLDAGGRTVALLGSGLDRAWPDGHVLERVKAEGVLLTEFAPGTPPRRHHFPLRNRILAACVDAVLVVEAAWASGSLITARWGADLGKPVFALPGRIDSPFGQGILRLLREGATPVGSPGDLLAQLDDGTIRQPLPGRADPLVGPGPRATSEPVLRALVADACGAGTLAERLGWELPRVLARLAELELDDRVRRLPGGLWSLPP